MTQRTAVPKYLLAALAVLFTPPVLRAEAARYCAVQDGIVAEVAPGPFVESSTTVTFKSAWTAEYRWDVADPEAIAWMRIVDENGAEIGWVPAGHEGINCAKAD